MIAHCPPVIFFLENIIIDVNTIKSIITRPNADKNRNKLQYLWLKGPNREFIYTIYKYFIFFKILFIEKNGRKRRRIFRKFLKEIFHFGHVQNDFSKKKMSKKLSVAATIFLRFIIPCLKSLLTNQFFWTFFWTCSWKCVFARTFCANLFMMRKNKCPK